MEVQGAAGTDQANQRLKFGAGSTGQYRTAASQLVQYHERNNWVVGLATNGEGWHNNHHADPRSAMHGHCWWDLDITYATICLWEKCGLVWNIVPPRRKNLTKSELSVENEAVLQ